MLKVDPYTKEEFFTKKRNQKFASKANQVAYNNELKAVEKDNLLFVTKKLYNNRNILKKALKEKQSITVTKDYLMAENFCFYCITHYKIIDNINHFGIFEYSYSVTDQEQINIRENGRELLNKIGS